jgi:HlyD family secretion protein
MLNSFEGNKLTKLLARKKFLAALGAMLLVSTSAIVWRLNQQPVSIAKVTYSQAPAPTINSLGRLEPQGEVTKVAAPSQGEIGSIVTELLVAPGDRVQRGQVLAVLDSRDRALASLSEAQNQVRVAQFRLKNIVSGAKRGEIAAAQAEITNLKAESSGESQVQQATIARLAAELQNADDEFRRNQTLYREGAISASALDSRKLAMRTAQEQLLGAKANFNRFRRTLKAQIQKAEANAQTLEVRPTEINTAQAEVYSAKATANRQQIELNRAFVRAPRAGQVLQVRTKAGESVGTNGIVEIAQTNPMMAISEVYESDITKIRLGQMALVTSPSNVFSGQLRGTVKQIGLQIAKKDILDSDPTAATDARVIEVKIQLDAASSQQVANLIGLQVNVEINL